jgi:Alpha galactosidase A
VSSIIDQWSRTSPDDVLVNAAGPGHWNDPDMLMVGNPGLSISEQQAQFCLWAIFASPLLISADLSRMHPDSKEILLNEEVIAVNQDPMGRQGWCAQGANTHLRVYIRELLPSSGEPCPKGQSDIWAIVLANFMSIFHGARIDFDPRRHLPNGDQYDFFELWDLLKHEHYDNVMFKNYSATVDESSVFMYKIVLRKYSVRDAGPWTYRKIDLGDRRSGFVADNQGVTLS